MSPPPLGRSLAILTYWIIITLFLTAGSIIHDAYYWERIGFRAAWVSVTQVPLIYLLAGKVNVLSIFFGSSYIDLNWIHKWVSRTLFVTVTIHGGFFITEWVRADFFQPVLDMMPMVRYGLGMWGVLAWTMISSLLPLRRLCYELFVLQHLASAAVFLCLLYKHVPSYAVYNVWMAVAFALSGRVLRSSIFLFRNLSTSRMGHLAELKALPGDITVVTIRDINFSWKAGQHILLWCPTLGPLESHPFTISNISNRSQEDARTEIDLVIRVRTGFTRRLNRRAASSQSAPCNIRAFVTGPFGSLPSWNTFETIVLISASTGASFTLPILESILLEPCCVSRIDCLLLVRDRVHVDAYLQRLKAAAAHDQVSKVDLRIEIAVTGEVQSTSGNTDDHIELSSLKSSGSSSGSSSNGPPSAPLITHTEEVDRKQPLNDDEKRQVVLNPITQITRQERYPRLHYSRGRPRLANMIRGCVEASAGETSVVVCGGKSLTSTVRNCVAGLSDERAVHKGTGAQGIHLHVEEFGS